MGDEHKEVTQIDVDEVNVIDVMSPALVATIDGLRYAKIGVAATTYIRLRDGSLLECVLRRLK